MSTVEELFQQAQLAEAAYANFLNANTHTVATDSELVKAALQDASNNMEPSVAIGLQGTHHLEVHGPGNGPATLCIGCRDADQRRNLAGDTYGRGVLAFTAAKSLARCRA